jgi:hypothetical protein
MTVTNLTQIRGEECPHALSLVSLSTKKLICSDHAVPEEVAIGCPVCGYILKGEANVNQLNAPVATFWQGTADALVDEIRKARTPQ